MTISIAIVTNERRKLTDRIQDHSKKRLRWPTKGERYEPIPRPCSALRDAAAVFLRRSHGDAPESYRRTIRESSGTSSAAEARFNLARTLAWHDNPQRDYAAALQEFDEFMRLYPDHGLAPEARSWRHLLKTVDDLKKSIEQLKKSLEQLKKLDIKHEERRKRR